MTKTTVRVWGPVRQRLEAALERAGLKRDAYLNRLLEVEIPALDEEVSRSNSLEARRFVARDLKRMSRMASSEPMTLMLREDLLNRLDRVCFRKCICRDAFFNRVFFLLTADSRTIDAAFFDGDPRWRTEVWGECKNEGPFFHNGFYPLNPEVDPFWTIRAGLKLWADERLGPKDWEPVPIYQVLLAEMVRGRPMLLLGTSCALDDEWVIGSEAAHAAEQEWKALMERIDKRTAKRRGRPT